MLPALGLLILLGAAPADSSPSCAADLAGLDGKLRADYAGYLLELRGDRLQKYTAMKAALEARARRTMGDSCSFVLHDFTEWFDDPHLFVFQNPVIDSAETLRREKSVAKRHVTEASARAYYRQHETHLDPIEGIWYDRGLRVAIVPDPSKSAGHFVAVVLAADTSTWTPGSVRASIARRTDGSYDVDLSAPDYFVSHLHGAIYRHVLLRLSPGIWGKAFPVPRADSGTLDPVDPHRPTVYQVRRARLRRRHERVRAQSGIPPRGTSRRARAAARSCSSRREVRSTRLGRHVGPAGRWRAHRSRNRECGRGAGGVRAPESARDGIRRADGRCARLRERVHRVDRAG